MGWVVAPKKIIQNLWKYKDYTTISISALSDKLARAALNPDNRKKIFKRTRNIIRNNYETLESWMNRQEGLFKCVPSKAGAFSFPGYAIDINASKLAEIALREKSVLIQPSDHQKVDFHIRIGLGEKPEKFKKVLKRLQEVFQKLS